ncbi:hypothetical protein ACWCPM_28350 [Streptomyces sp. NPDC002309]
MCEVAPQSGPGLPAKVRYHPFKKINCFTSGGMRGALDGNEEVIDTGELARAGTEGTHGLVNERNENARWIEAWSPAPPPSDGFFFPEDRRKPAEGH